MAKKMNKWPFKFVEVVWEDTHSDARWRRSKEPLEPIVVHHRGWLIVELKKSITVAGSILGAPMDGEFDVGDVTTIPRGCIVSITDLGV
jgi:hypothetical protein